LSHHGGIINGCHSFHKWDFASASPETQHLQANLELSIARASSKSHPEAAAAAAADFWFFVHPQPSKFHQM